MRKVLIINLLSITIFLFATCHETERYENTSLFSFKDFKSTTKLNATTIEFDEPIMLPFLFVKSDSLLIVQNIRTNNLLFVYNVNSRKKIGEFISFGSGPNDLLRIKNMQLVGSYLYISDSQKRTVSKYNIKDFHESTGSLLPIHKVTIEHPFNNIAYTENGYVATAMTPDNKRLVFYNSEGEKAFATGEYPYFGKDLTIIEKMEGFSSCFAVSHKYKRIYLFGNTTDLIEIYDFKGKLIKQIHGPEQIFPQAKEVSLPNGMARVSALEKSTFAFFHPIIVDDEIYVSYSGNHYNIEEQNVTIQHILVFDMDGSPLRKYELSKSIVSFTVDPETKSIYAASNIPDYHLVIFEE